MNYEIKEGDCVEILRSMDDRSVNCCVTSPPYWGLRDYGTARWDGGDAECDHIEGLRKSTYKTTDKNRDAKAAELFGTQYRDTCGKCGARRVDDQLGLESTPDEYVAKMVEVFREVRRVLRDDGTLWLNLGDSYSGVGKSGGGSQGNRWEAIGAESDEGKGTWKPPTPGLKHKDLVGIPWRVAFALQADGWYLRQDIIWHKPNPMPESVRDRCTKGHEYLFLLAKSERYYCDMSGVREMAVDGGARNRRSVWTVTTRPFKGAHFAVFPPKLIEPCVIAGCPEGGTVLEPFAGSGTTGCVSLEHGRNFVGIELNPEYAEMARKRIKSVVPRLFFDVAT